ncbi:MAG: metallophosphoesterase [Anaerolineales bacterium]|nr:metallophosphoesterase [Anaerolineales bacterium]MDW8162749.1 metallophosphoesterase [Anaerolineales bacterium]
MKFFFATDVHGSEICWKKFISGGKFYGVDTLILGGDMTGKAIVPIIAQGNNKWKVTLLEQEMILEGKEAVDKMVVTIMNRGYYPHVTDPDEVKEIAETPGRSDELFHEYVLKTIQRWMEYADEKLAGTGIRCYVCPGNDDVFEIDEVIAQSKTVQLAEGRVIWLDDHHEMISTGWSNPTPWETHREEEEEKLLQRIEAMVAQVSDVSNAIFNLHAPPYGSGLDEAPELTKDMRLAYAGRSMVPVGSKAVLRVIEKYQPLLSLHGHIHEGKGTRKYRRTLCINAGSQYEQGILQGVVVELEPKKIRSYVLTTG